MQTLTLNLTGVDVISHPRENIETHTSLSIFILKYERQQREKFHSYVNPVPRQVNISPFCRDLASFLVFTRCLNSGKK